MQMTNIMRTKVLPGLYSNLVIYLHPSFIQLDYQIWQEIW